MNKWFCNGVDRPFWINILDISIKKKVEESKKRIGIFMFEDKFPITSFISEDEEEEVTEPGEGLGTEEKDDDDDDDDDDWDEKTE